jgi:hypothetical protein
VKLRMLTGMLILLGVWLLLCAGARQAGAAKAASRDTAQAIVSQALETYGVPVEAGEIVSAVSSALDSGVPPEEVRSLAVAAARAGRSPAETTRLLTLVADFRRNDLPTEAAVSTILEGIAKEASPESIEGAVRTTKRNIRFCVSLAASYRTGKRGADRRNDLLVQALSLALNDGFGESALEQVSDAIRLAGNGADYFITCLETMLELGGTSFPRDKVAGLVGLAVKKRFSAKDFSRLSGLVALKIAGPQPNGPQPNGPGRTEQGRVPFSYDAVFDFLLEEMQKSARPSDFFTALGYGAQSGQGKPSTGNGAASGPSPAGSTGGSSAGSGGGGSQGGSGGGGSGGSRGGKN